MTKMATEEPLCERPLIYSIWNSLHRNEIEPDLTALVLWSQKAHVFSIPHFSFSSATFFFFFGCTGFSLMHSGLSLVVASGGDSLVVVRGLLLQWLPLMQSTGSRQTGFSRCPHGLSCPTIYGIFPDWGSNP